MSHPEDDQQHRVRQARQVLSGADLRAPDDPIRFGQEYELVNPTQRAYLLAVGGLLIVSLLVLLIFDLGVASVLLFLLALALLLGWVVF